MSRTFCLLIGCCVCVFPMVKSVLKSVLHLKYVWCFAKIHCFIKDFVLGKVKVKLISSDSKLMPQYTRFIKCTHQYRLCAYQSGSYYHNPLNSGSPLVFSLKCQQQNCLLFHKEILHSNNLTISFVSCYTLWFGDWVSEVNHHAPVLEEWRDPCM